MATFEHYKVVIPANFFHISFIHEVTGVDDQVINTLGIGVGAGTSTEANFVDLADAWATNIVIPIMSNATTFTRMLVRDSTGVVLDIDRADVGTSGTSIVPVNCAAVVEKRTGIGGRRNRGRVFIPGIPESQVNEAGLLETTYRDGIDADFVAFQSDVEAIDPGEWFTFILHSKGWDGAVEPADPGNAPAPSLITSWVTKPGIGTQRRRLR